MRKLLIATLVAAVAGPTLASGEDELTSLSYISYLERYATVQPATQQDSVEALINMPLVPGDRIDTARQARMEVILADANVLWIDEYTTVSLDAVAFSRDGRADQTVLFLGEGTVMVEVSDHRLNEQPLRIDGPSATVYLSDAGLYRILALPAGGLRLEVWEGLAEAATIAGGVLVRAQSATELAGGEVLGSESQLAWGDEFARWVEQRRLVIQGESSQYVDARYGRQAAQLDNYGNWVFLSEYNTWAWQPVVSSSWRPYSAGRWYWTPTGWSWVSYEPWGWLPYHYGNWYFSVGFGWVWSWHPYWSPAWVSWSWWPGYVGWCPYGYYWGWYWPRYSHYYGYPHWPYPGHPSYPGGGGGQQPPRRAAIPRPGAGGSEAADGGRTAIPRPNEIALDLNGRVRVEEIDRAGWNVVSTRDFASPHLSRLVQPGEAALRGRDDVGVVVSDPLMTEPPSRVRPSEELERVFRGFERSASRDITPILARDSGLRGEDALRLVEPTTVREISRRSAAAVSEAPRVATREPGDRAVLSTSPDSPFARSAGSSRGQVSTSQPGLSTRQPGDRVTAAPNPFVPRSRPSSAAAAPPTQGRSGDSGLGSVRSSPLNPGTRSGAPTTRVLPPTGRGSSSPGPVVVPRTSPSGSSPGIRSAPSAPRSSVSSRPRSSSSTARPSSAGRSSSVRAPSSSRSSGAVSSAPRSAPSSTARSSGGARRR